MTGAETASQPASQLTYLDEGPGDGYSRGCLRVQHADVQMMRCKKSNTEWIVAAGAEDAWQCMMCIPSRSRRTGRNSQQHIVDLGMDVSCLRQSKKSFFKMPAAIDLALSLLTAPVSVHIRWPRWRLNGAPSSSWSRYARNSFV